MARLAEETLRRGFTELVLLKGAQESASGDETILEGNGTVVSEVFFLLLIVDSLRQPAKDTFRSSLSEGDVLLDG